jgi:hypothetical protein
MAERRFPQDGVPADPRLAGLASTPSTGEPLSLQRDRRGAPYQWEREPCRKLKLSDFYSSYSCLWPMASGTSPIIADLVGRSDPGSSCVLRQQSQTSLATVEKIGPSSEAERGVTILEPAFDGFPRASGAPLKSWTFWPRPNLCGRSLSTLCTTRALESGITERPRVVVVLTVREAEVVSFGREIH